MARIALDNPAKVSVQAIEAVCMAADLPVGKVQLLMGSSRLVGDYQAATYTRRLISGKVNLSGLEDYLKVDWDCAVVVGELWAKSQPEYPCYFSYLLGHEFGHASTALTEVGLTVYEILLQDFAKTATKGAVTRWDQMPHEAIYDQFGIAIAESIHGREAIEEEFGRIAAAGLSNDVPRIEKVLTLTPSKDLSNLREELASFSLPYKDDYIKLWEDARRQGRLPVASGLMDLGALWNAGD
jgi:hypothetical protein